MSPPSHTGLFALQGFVKSLHQAESVKHEVLYAYLCTNYWLSCCYRLNKNP